MLQRYAANLLATNKGMSVQEAAAHALERLMAKLKMSKTDASAALHAGNPHVNDELQCAISPSKEEMIKYIAARASTTVVNPTTEKLLGDDAAAKTIYDLRNTFESVSSAAAAA